jgi:catechol 2,3-dioxygenase-like lactoylglutathione lyase family enzyme
MYSLISQLSHVEIITPTLEQSRRFFVDVMGLIETARRNRSIYLRGWRNFFHHDLVLSEGREPALGHIGWRSAGAASAAPVPGNPCLLATCWTRCNKSLQFRMILATVSAFCRT